MATPQKLRKGKRSKRGGALTPKQLAFCADYLVDLNATQAAIRAGYSAKTAASQGERLLRNVEIQAEIKRLMDERARRTEITGDRVLQELGSLAFFDPAALVEAGIRGPADIAKLPEEVRRAIVGWSWDKAGNFTLKLSDKIRSLDLLGQHLGLWKSKLELTGRDGGPIQTEGEFRPSADDEAMIRRIAEARENVKREQEGG